MKLRMTHNSIRVRIRKSELALLQENQLVEESIGFPMGTLFKFALVLGENEAINAQFEDNNLVLSIPQKEALEWIDTNQVGIEAHIQLPNEEQLHLLIEKDFPCLDRPEEDKSDTFWELTPENPDAC